MAQFFHNWEGPAVLLQVPDGRIVELCKERMPWLLGMCRVLPKEIHLSMPKEIKKELFLGEELRAQKNPLKAGFFLAGPVKASSRSRRAGRARERRPH